LYPSEAPGQHRDLDHPRTDWGGDEIWVDCHAVNRRGGDLNLRKIARGNQNNRGRTGASDVRHFSKSGEIFEVAIKPERLRGFHVDTQMKQSYIMAAVGREAADFEMPPEDAKQFCEAMIENLFGGTLQTLSHLENAFFQGYKKHLGYDAVHERVLMRRGVYRKR
jgi:hypothetical protein